MATLLELIERIVVEFARLQTEQRPYRDENGKIDLPRLIPTGNGGSLVVSREIDRTIAAVADQLMASDPMLPPKYTRADWRAIVRLAFGSALAGIDLTDEPGANANALLAEVRTTLANVVSQAVAQEFAFGCSLFDNAEMQPFDIGPVCFEPRLLWLARKHEAGAISSTTRNRIERAWSGKRLGKRKLSHDSIYESDVHNTIGDSAFVLQHQGGRSGAGSWARESFHRRPSRYGCHRSTMANALEDIAGAVSSLRRQSLPTEKPSFH